MIALLLAGLAQASEPSHTENPAAPHGAASHTTAEGSHGEGSHGEAASHGGGGNAGGHHVTYSDDEDMDGVPNWRDPSTGSAPNSTSYVVPGLAWHAVNLAVLVAILGWFVRRPLVDSFRERVLHIRNDLAGSARDRDDARKRHQDLIVRLQRIEDEVRAMEATAATEAAREEAKLVERAQREAERISEQAERSMRDETNRARIALRNEAVELAVRLAEATLRQRVGASERTELAREFLRSLKEGDRV